MHKIDVELAKLINDAAEDCGYDTRSYSGRAMYGATCLGIEFDGESASDIVIDIISDLFGCHGDDRFLDAMDALKGAKTDSMGLGGIIYWPHIPFVDSEDSDESED